jgi:hypothetical protein
MTDQLAFDYRNTDPATSRDAAIYNLPNRSAPRMVIGRDGLEQDRRPAPSGASSLVWVAIEYQRADAKGAS